MASDHVGPAAERLDSSSSSVLPLPDLPENQRGTSVASTKHYKAEVSNASGYLCHIHLEVNFDVPPEVVYQVFMHPDNAGVFRDIKQVGYRKVLQEKPGWKLVEVEQCGELRVMFVRRVFRTYLTVEEDARDTTCLRIHFKLLRSDILGRFQGEWQLRPLTCSETGAVVGTCGVLEQDILPKGMPPFFANLPVLGGLLRRISLNTISRLVEDINTLITRYKASPGEGMDAVMRAVALERGHTPAPGENFGAAVTSHALGADDFSASAASSSSSEEGEEAGAGQGGPEGAGDQGKQQKEPEAVEVVAAGAGGSAGAMAAGAALAHHHHHHHEVDKVLGVNVDVTVDGAVHLALVTNPLYQEGPHPDRGGTQTGAAVEEQPAASRAAGVQV